MAKLSVGRSYRTPAKHGALSASIGLEVKASDYLPFIYNKQINDLTAGDGVVNEDLPGGWAKNCSPGIDAYYARYSDKPIWVNLFEIQPATFDRLIENLSEQLPLLGYKRDGDLWVCNKAKIRTICGDGGEMDITEIGSNTCVMLVNDPNAITSWAMPSSLVSKIITRTRWLRTMSTMGCNASGLKRGILLEDRMPWFDHVEAQVDNLPPRHDLLLARIERDGHLWAYLFCEPEVWRDKIERAVCSAFGKHGFTMEYAWRKTQPERFFAIEEYLFLTKEERKKT